MSATDQLIEVPAARGSAAQISSIRNVSRANVRLERVVFGSLIGIIALSALPYGSVEQWWRSAIECSIFLLTAVWLASDARAGVLKAPAINVALPILALAVLAFIQSISTGSYEIAGVKGTSSALSAAPYESRLVAITFLAYASLFLLLARYTTTLARFRILILTVIGVAVFSALFGLARQTMQGESGGFLLSYLERNSGYAQFINRNHFAFLMEMGIGMILGIILIERRQKSKLISFLAALIIIWAATVFSGSRGGVIASVAQLAFAAFLMPGIRLSSTTEKGRKRKNLTLIRSRGLLALRILMLLVVLAVSAIGVLHIGGEAVISRFEAASEDFGGASSRTEIWRATISLIKAQPITGVGFGGYLAAIPRFHQASGKVTPHQAHNDYLELVASGGIAGAVIGIWFVIVFVRKARRNLGSSIPFQGAGVLGALIGLAGVAVHSLFDFGLHIPVNALVAIVLLVIASVRLDSEPVASLKKGS